MFEIGSVAEGVGASEGPEEVGDGVTGVAPSVGGVGGDDDCVAGPRVCSSSLTLTHTVPSSTSIVSSTVCLWRGALVPGSTWFSSLTP